MTSSYLRLLRIGFDHAQAQTLAKAGFDVIAVVPLGHVVNGEHRAVPADRGGSAR